MTSRDERRDSRARGPQQLRNLADVGAAAVERLESALYRVETGGSTNAAQVDALASIAASLMRLAGSPAGSDETKVHTRQLAALIADVAALREELGHTRTSLGRLLARVDQLEDQP